MIKNILFGAVIPLALVVGGLGVMIGMQRPDPGKKPPVADTRAALLGQLLSAEVEKVRALAEVTETLDIPVSGTVVPFREIQLAAEVAGRIIDKNPHTRSGNLVAKGDMLYRIDPRDYELEVERVERRLEQERATLEEQEQDIANAQRLLEVADQELQLAEADVKRFETLGSNFRSQAELDQAKRSRLASMNQKVSIQNQVSLLKARKTRMELAIRLAETELEQTQLNLNRTTVRAPVDGRVVTEQVEADSYVQRGTPLVTIEDTSQVEVAANVRMDQLYWILDQQQLSSDALVNAAQATAYELPRNAVKLRYELAGRESVTYQWDGVLSRYDGAGIDPQSRTVPIRVVVENPNDFTINGIPARESNLSGPASLVRGMFVDVVIQAKPTTPLLLVPKLSVKPATGSNQIWKFIPDESALERTRERLAQTNNLATEESAPIENANEAPKVVDDPEQWAAGFLRVVSGVEVIGPYRPAAYAANSRQLPAAETEVEYWICDAVEGGLAPGDMVVITPLPGVEAEGDEAIRVKKSQLD